MNELFDKITEIIASPHTTITEHDEERAVKILSEIVQHIEYTTENVDHMYRKYFTSNVKTYLRGKYEEI